MKHNQPVLDWLLEKNNPSIRYRTMTELLGISDDDVNVIRTKKQIPASDPVVQILEKMHPDGYWLQKNPRSGEIVGDGVKYGAFASTHFCLAYLSELGLDCQHPQVAQAADRYLNLQQEDGDFRRHFSCLYGYNIRTFIRLGLRDDPRVQKSIDLMLSTERPDGGYLCDMHAGKYKNKATKSCIRGSVKVLLAFSELPEYWEHPRCRALSEYFLKRDGIYRTSDLSQPINHDVMRTAFPITWHASLLEILYALSKLGYGDLDNLKRAWQILETKRDGEGRYLLDWSPSQALLRGGRRKAANKWVTFYALLAKKYQVNAHPNPA
jgi:hypothetical protein